MRGYRSAFFLMAIVLAALSPAAGAVAAGVSPADKARAAELTAEGQKIMDGRYCYFNYGAESFIFCGCDADEIAGEKFRQAFELDPDNYEAELGLMLADDQKRKCLDDRSVERMLYEYSLAPRPKPEPETNAKAESRRKRWAETADALERRVKANPEQARGWIDWGRQLFSLASEENDGARRRALLAEASAKYQKAVELKHYEPAFLAAWGTKLIEAALNETDPREWPRLLDQAQEKFIRQMKLQPVEQLDPGIWSEFMPHNMALNSGIKSLTAPALTTVEVEKAEAMLAKALELIELKKELPHSDRVLYQLSLAELYLRRAAVGQSEKELLEATTQARCFFDQALTEAKEEDAQVSPRREDFNRQSRFNEFITTWLTIAGTQTDSPRREIMAAEAADFFETRAADLFQQFQARPPASLKLGDLDEKYLSYLSGTLIDTAKVMPKGRKRDELLARAEKTLEEAVTLADEAQEPARRLELGVFLLAWAKLEESDDKFNDLRQQAHEQYLQALARSNQPDQVRFRWTRKLSARAWELDESRQIQLLEAALAEYETGGFKPSSPFEYEYLGDLYFRLGRLYKKQKNPIGLGEWMDKAAEYYILAIEDQRRPNFSQPQANDQRLFKVSQLFSVWPAGSDDRLKLNPARRYYRRYFEQLPLRLEHPTGVCLPFSPPDEPLSYLCHQAGQPMPENMNLASFQAMFTARAAMDVQKIYQANDPLKLSSEDLFELAGMHRHLAGSGMMTIEYQRLYWRRAEDFLRRALENLPPFEEPRTDGSEMEYFWEGEHLKARTRLQVMAELGLVLCEQTLVDDENREGRLGEAEELWRKAEALRPGAARYARARWAAWRGDREGMLADIGHSQGETALGLFPAFEEAVEDPALADFRHEGWFRRAWYGFGVGPNASGAVPAGRP